VFFLRLVLPFSRNGRHLGSDMASSTSTGILVDNIQLHPVQASNDQVREIINSRVMRTLGPQKTGMLGITLMSLSGILSSFAYKNVGALFATSVVVLGLGIG
jgi:hypothetical protein